MMPPIPEHAAIALAYDTLAERWLDERFNQDNGIRQHAQALRFLGDGVAGGWALNVGCGCNTRFNPPLREKGLQLEGIDISGRMIALAEEADPGVLLHHADICTWTIPRAYRFISAWDSIWHVGLDEQRPLMRKLMGALDVGGVFIFTAGGLDGPDTHVDATMGPQVSYSTLGIPGLLEVIGESGCICRHLEFDQTPHKHLVVIVERVA